MVNGQYSFDLQGHRGARGLRPENTLPSFETAFDIGVSTVETDLHLTADGVIVLVHDPVIGENTYRRISEGVPEPADRPLVRGLSLAQLRCYRGDKNPDPGRFPDQNAGETPLAIWFGKSRGIDPYGIPTLSDLLAFAEAYAGEPGKKAGKTAPQQTRAQEIRFDLEIKTTPFQPQWPHDALERQLVHDLRNAGMVQRAIVRSFDHRSLPAMRSLEPSLMTAVLVSGTAPVEPARLATAAGAQVYCPYYQFLDENLLRQLHAAGIRVVPWTVNDAADLARLLDWGVDGVTTDYPDRFASVLGQRKIAF
jgi:glycerophosphoryl diester phosphodiesterase